jgi:GT2 family glycosyltransferase
MSGGAPQTSPTVFVVMAVHNRRQTTLACLAKLAEQSYQPLEVVVIDDGSTDGTSEAIRAAFPQVALLTGDGNLWWTGAMAMGVDHLLAQAADDDLVLSLNDDVRFDADYIAALVEASQTRGGAIVGSFCRCWDDPAFIINQGFRVDWRRARYTPVPGLLAEALATIDKTEETMGDEDLDALDALDGLDYLFGRGTLAPVAAYRQAGNYDAEKFPHYFGDSEWTVRAAQAGFPLVLSLRARIETGRPDADGRHYHSVSDAWRMLTSRRSAYELAGGMRFMTRCCPRRYRLRNKARFIRIALSLSVGGTRAAAPIRKAVRAMRGKR